MIEVLKHQPIQTRFRCTDCDEYSLMQLVIPDDEQRVQVKCHPRKALQPFLYTDWTLTGAVSFETDFTRFQFSGTASVSVPVSMVYGRRYRIEINAAFTTIPDGAGYRVKLNNQWVQLPDATNGAYSIVGGKIVAYVTAHTLVSPALLIETTGAGLSLLLFDISVAEISRAGLMVLDASKNLIVDFGLTNSVEMADSNITTLWIDWSEVDYEGICYLCIYDTLDFNTQLLVNGDFSTDILGWDNGIDGVQPHAQWAWFGGVPTRAWYTGAGTTGFNQLTQLITVPGGSLYNLQFTVSGITPLSGEGVSVSFVINGTETTGTAYTLTNSYTQELDLSAYTGMVEVRVVFTPIHTTDTFFIYGVSFKRVQDTSNITNPFTLQVKHSGTVVFFGRSNASAHGFNFTNYFAQMRVRARVEYIQYPDKTDIYEWSDNVEDIIDSEAKKNYRVQVLGNPEYIHDALRLMRLCDNYTINDIYYIRAGDYELEKTKDMCPAGATFELREKTGIADNEYNAEDEYTDAGYTERGYW